MKRRDLIQYIKKQGGQVLREGGNHTLFINRKAKKATTVPRHREVNEFLARKICRDLEIPGALKFPAIQAFNVRLEGSTP